MGNRISHMNVFALSTVVRADAVDVENILRRFERRAPKYPTVDHTGRFGKKRTFELVPVKDNDPNAEFNVDSMSAVEHEALEEERLAELEAAEAELEAKAKGTGEGDKLTKQQRASLSGDQMKAVDEKGEDNECHYENENGERKEVNTVKEEREDIEERVDDEGTIGGEEGTNDLGSVVSQQSQTSIITPMVEMEGKLASMYTERKLDPEPGWDLPGSYIISLDDMMKLAKDCNMHESDLEILDAMFRLVDSRGFEEADIRAVMVPLAICTCKNSVAECISLVLTLFDRAETETIEKTQMLRIFNLINEGIMYAGDRPLDSAYVTDLIDSVFTSSGKIDGYINYTEYIELICEHPIVEMFLTPQFQGLARDKVFDKETLQDVEVNVNIDYSQKTV